MIAKQNIIVYKEFRKTVNGAGKEVLRAPYYGKRNWGRTTAGRVLSIQNFDQRPIVCSRGIHAWTEWRNCFIMGGNSLWVCVIPKGTLIYKDKREKKMRAQKLILVHEIGLRPNA